MAIKNVTFIDKWSIEQDAKGFNGFLVKHLSTRFKSHAGVGSQMSGYTFCRPVMNLFVIRQANTDVPSICWWKAVIAARLTLIEFVASSDLFNDSRYSTINGSGVWFADICLFWHQMENLFHF